MPLTEEQEKRKRFLELKAKVAAAKAQAQQPPVEEAPEEPPVSEPTLPPISGDLSPKERAVIAAGRTAAPGLAREAQAWGQKLTKPPELPYFKMPFPYSPKELSLGQQFTAGRHKGNPQEIQAALGGEVSELNGRLFWRKDPQDSWQPLNKPGFSLGDVARITGEQLGPTAGSAVMALGGKTPLGTAARAATGAVFGDLANEAIQAAEGTQRESLPEIGAHALKVGGEFGLFAGLPGGATIGRGPLTANSRRMAEDLRNTVRFVNEGRAKGFDYPSPMPIDIMTMTGKGPVPGNIIGRVGAQVEGGTGAMSGLREDMAQQAGGEARREFLMTPEQAVKANREIVGYGNRAREGVRANLRRAGPGLEQGAARATEGINEAGGVADWAVSRQYEGPLTDALKTEKPQFNLGPAKAEWKVPKLSRTELVDTGVLDANGLPIRKAITNQVNAIDSPGGKLRWLKRLASTFDDIQGPEGFWGIKEIRSEVGSLLKKDRFFRDRMERPAEAFYAQLTRVMKNPVNKADTPAYLRELETAESLTKWSKSARKDTGVKAAVKGKGSGDLIRSYVSNPEALMGPEFRKFMDLAPESARTDFRKAMQQAMLDSRDPFKTIDKLNSGANSAPYEYMFNSPADRKAFEARATAVSKFWNSPSGKIFDSQVKGYEATQALVRGVKDPRTAHQIYAQLSPAEKDVSRMAIMDDAVNASLRRGERTGIEVVSPSALETEMRRLKDTGLWGYLERGQQRRLTDMASFYRTTLTKLSDVGASLENASIAADLKNLLAPWDPTSFVKALRSIKDIAHYKILAYYLTDPARANKLMDRIQQAPVDARPAILATVGSAPYVVGYSSETNQPAAQLIEALSKAPDYLPRKPKEAKQ